MYQYIDSVDAVPVRRIRQAGKLHQTGRNIEQLIILGIIEMVMMIGVGIEHAVLIMDRHPPQQAGIGELVQCVIDGAKRHLDAGVLDLACQAVCRYMPMTAIKQQCGKCKTLARRAQASVAQFLGQIGSPAGCGRIDNFFHG